jgi:hypothetical protein
MLEEKYYDLPELNSLYGNDDSEPVVFLRWLTPDFKYMFIIEVGTPGEHSTVISVDKLDDDQKNFFKHNRDMIKSLGLNVIYSDDYTIFCKTLICQTFEYQWDVKQEYMYDIFDQVPNKKDLISGYVDGFVEDYLKQ